MAFKRTTQQILTDAPGMVTELNIFEFGPEGATTKIYMQASLHADEQPGMMALHHLIPLLKKADEDGALKAKFVVLPMVNPLGMAQHLFQTHMGRYDFRSGTNFNRKWPDLYAAIAEDVASLLGDDADENKRIIRGAVKSWLDGQNPQTALQRQRIAVMKIAYDADYVLDLHCDDDADNHLFVTPDSMEELYALADWMESKAQLTAEDSGGGSFDEIWPTLWSRLRAAHPEKNIPFSGVAATLEYRGRPDVFDELGKPDADNLFAFFQAKGFIAGTPNRTPAKAPAPTSLDATEMLRVDDAGLIAYRVQVGDVVKKGQPVADLITLAGDGAFEKRTPILAGTDGFVLSRSVYKYAMPGTAIAKIVGREPIVGRKGYLLQD